ncbi:MAG: response regulator [Alphaproteobacteria bacterium]|nr:response regulator [Alphaproteobacteria bacterium]MBL7098432.1 response regulator [Alphaproteobacteria bacterium]
MFGDDSEETVSEAPKFCLIVDDSSTIRKFSARLLTSMNFIVGEAEHGLAAVEACRLVVPDLVLLDWNMPEMNGLECLKALRAMDLKPRPAIVMCTTENVLPKITEALAAGADEYIMKPFDRDVLRDKLAQLELV